MFGSMGITELVLILFIVLIIFGAGKLPQLGEGLGKAIKGFKKSVHEADAIELEAQQAQVQQQPGQPAPDATAAAQAVPPAGTPGAPPPPSVASAPPKV
jgi:sec-independent protein translocase protein TatA